MLVAALYGVCWDMAILWEVDGGKKEEEEGRRGGRAQERGSAVVTVIDGRFKAFSGAR